MIHLIPKKVGSQQQTSTKIHRPTAMLFPCAPGTSMVLRPSDEQIPWLGQKGCAFQIKKICWIFLNQWLSASPKKPPTLINFGSFSVICLA
jgi:hypothetical protein